MKKIYTVAVIGLGGRGGDVYAPLIFEKKDCFKIVALCDLNREKLSVFQNKFGLAADCCFSSEEEFFKEKRADLLVIATPDTCHARQCLAAFALGYDVMTEKPLTDVKDECEALLAAQKKYGGKALVCHVLRYAPAFIKAAEILNSGAIGQLVAIDALERVQYAHQAHSYVRGNWRNRKLAAPMILAKCCHDLDLLQFYAKSKCKSISSVGDLMHFKKENAPDGATEKCLDCPHVDTCAYSAKKNYLDLWEASGKPDDCWPWNVIAQAPLTKEKILVALRETNYGQCAYLSDNDVVDHQLTMMTFENGVKATLTMTAFTATGGRRMYFHGTHGELVLDEQDNTLRLHIYGQDAILYPLSELNEKGYGHGGGDAGLVNQLYDMLTGNTSQATSLEASVESHLMGICAEESRLKGGELVYIHK